MVRFNGTERVISSRYTLFVTYCRIYLSLFRVFRKTFPCFPIHNEEKESIIKVRMGHEKSVPRDHRLSSLGKPSDANR